MISFCAAGSPLAGLRKTTSTPVSPSAFLLPASAMVQKEAALLLTNPTLGLLGPLLLHAGTVSRSRPTATEVRKESFMVRLDFLRKLEFVPVKPIVRFSRGLATSFGEAGQPFRCPVSVRILESGEGASAGWK